MITTCYHRFLRQSSCWSLAICSGNAYSALKEYQRAIENFDRAIFLNSQNASAYYNRGNAFYNLQEYQRAIADYDRALAIDPNYKKARNNRSEVSRLLNSK
ncbi:MAG: tetratricopeptide repeat protein [Ktedonobacteraceae bacterium]